ncbi:metallophosphoesterase [Pedobacter frigidisoli]|uniref:metallophosphoesterase n=1 Tax=Pedobacter frigidisoli TaxID=2530455 RepID=UPI00292E5B67|nr:metallophosphoesterase [Pedobacter frigidisoli]
MNAETFQFISDIHLEYASNREFLKNSPILPSSDILLMAGDIMPLKDLRKQAYFLDFLSANYKTVYWIPGNHEFYGCDISEFEGSFSREIRKNVVLLNNQVVESHGCRLIFSTLWSKIPKRTSYEVRRFMPDFREIFFKEKLFSIENYNKLHEVCFGFLKKTITGLETKRQIVVSHHIPTFVNYPSAFRGSILNSAFATELGDWLIGHGPDYWIYGHHHQPVRDFTVGKTRMRCNQLGYVDNGEHFLFGSIAGGEQTDVIVLDAKQS